MHKAVAEELDPQSTDPAVKEINRTIIPIKSGYEARALCWHGDELIDWAGIIRYQLDGTSSGPEFIMLIHSTTLFLRLLENTPYFINGWEPRE
jgi:hypothetical protein